MKRFKLLLIVFFVGFVYAENAKLEKAALGSKENPVRCHMPQGEHAYLQRLTGPKGEKVTYRRRGSVIAGKDGHILDVYEVMYAGNDQVFDIYMDMYHDHIEKKAVKGFKIKNP